ncbi:MAG: hypothetical protein ACK2UO_05935, partial [Caldilineaceae bacterium]
MFLLEWSANDLLMMALAAIVMSGMVIWLVPGAKVARRTAFSESEITSYDREIPRYFLAAALALVIGGVHIVVKSLPGFWLWLWEAGYGGHLFRDLANSHIIIVGGGTVLLTGVTWYMLPRIVRRPLYSNAMASASLWFTVVGVFGFYLSWLILGLVEGSMVRHGMDYMAAKEAVGAWHRVPTRLTSSIMGVGYWTYVLNVFLTILAGRHIRIKPAGHLTKFVAVSAAALLIGTVQGVLQVLPANADWIHYAGKFGQYVDPISHAHINLVTGMMVSLAAFLVYFSPRLGGRPIGRATANFLFWTLAGGSLLFYLAFLLLGLILGNAVNGWGGLHLPALVPVLSQQRALILAVAGTLMLIGFWSYFVILWRSLGLRKLWGQLKEATPAGFWLASSIALTIGTFQGLLQVLPATAAVLTLPEEVPNIHAQLNMIGGVLLALIGLVFLLLPELTGMAVERRPARLALGGIGGGIAAYYAVVLSTGILRWTYMRQGMDVVESAAQLRWYAPVLLLASALPLLAGFAGFFIAVFRSTRTYRSQAAAELRQAPARYSGPMPARMSGAAPLRVLSVEFVGSLFGWPGAGWLFAGHAMPGVALLLIGPCVAWALLPMLFSPFTGTILGRWGWAVLLVWLPAAALLSTSALAYVLHRQGRLSFALRGAGASGTNAQAGLRGTSPQSGAEPAVDSQRQRPRIPRALVVGTSLVLLVLVSVPLIPMIMGLPDKAGNQLLMTTLSDRADGAYIELDDGSQRGIMKLFVWSFPTDGVPDETPSVSPDFFQSLLISQKGLDEPDRYRLYRIEQDDDGHEDHDVAIQLQSEVVEFERRLRLTPISHLDAGSYLLDIPIGGMFAGREYYYFRLDPSVSAMPAFAPPLPTSREGQASEPSSAADAPWLILLPGISALLAASMAFRMAQRMRDKMRPHEGIWTVAFVMFAVAAASQVVADLWGWSAPLARIYYVTGATLVVGWLGMGTLFLLARRPLVRTTALWLLLILSGFAVGLIVQTDVDAQALTSTGWHALMPAVPLTVLTIAFNSIGTLLLVGGALWSAWSFWRRGGQRNRMLGCVLLAVGALAIAAGGSLTRFGHDEYLYVAMSAG